MNHLKEIINEPIINKPEIISERKPELSKTKKCLKKYYKITCPKSDITKRGKEMIQ